MKLNKMIENDCGYKITAWQRTSRTPEPKCKRLGRYVSKCVGEKNCGYVKETNRIINVQLKKK